MITGRDELRLTRHTAAQEGENPDGAFVEYLGPRKLRLFGSRLQDLYGPTTLRLRIGNDLSEPIPVTAARVGRWCPALIAGAITLVAAVFLWLVARRVSTSLVRARRFGLLLDNETNTYSLSKFQLYAWTVALMLAYIFLLCAWTLVQQRFEFPPVPDNIIVLLAISLGTAAIAIGITAVRGPKGAGHIDPRVSDLISTGGLVAAERLQLLVWTVAGVTVFLLLVVAADPVGINELPRIPNSFLYLMGVSSIGYLAGKLARSPGPVVDSVLGQPGSLTLCIKGRRISREARFQINGAVLVTHPVRGNGAPVGLEAAIPPDALLTAVEEDSEAKEEGYASVLCLTVSDPGGWLTKHALPSDLLTPPVPSDGQPVPAPVGDPAIPTQTPGINPPLQGAGRWFHSKPRDKPPPKPIMVVINPDGQQAACEINLLRPSEARHRLPVPAESEPDRFVTV